MNNVKDFDDLVNAFSNVIDNCPRKIGDYQIIKAMQLALKKEGIESLNFETEKTKKSNEYAYSKIRELHNIASKLSEPLRGNNEREFHFEEIKDLIKEFDRFDWQE